MCIRDSLSRCNWHELVSGGEMVDRCWAVGETLRGLDPSDERSCTSLVEAVGHEHGAPRLVVLAIPCAENAVVIGAFFVTLLYIFLGNI